MTNTGKDFKEWRQKMGFSSQAAAAAALGYSRSMVKIWEARPEEHPVPLAARLAMTALYHRLSPWGTLTGQQLESR